MINLACTHSLAITGSGGTGAITAGNILLETAAKSSLYGFLRRSVGPQIRGGESAALLRVSSQPVTCPDDRFDLMLSFDWKNSERFALEIPLDSNSLVIFDPEIGELPDNIAEKNVHIMEIPLKALAKESKGGRINMVGLGVLADLMGLSKEIASEVISQTLASKGEEVVEAAVSCFEAGFHFGKPEHLFCQMPLSEENKSVRWNISGNEAIALGALNAGIRFVAAYPITPATDIVEWIAPRIEKIGGSIVQAEDELAAINMIIGASFGGVPSFTATSGPGLSLMSEGIGLAISSEVPAVIANVMRGGPSTGIPTKSEQADLNIALYGVHGDAPHIVMAPLNITDCVQTTQLAVQWAEALQTPAIILSDQYLGQSRQVTSAIALEDIQLSRAKADESLDDYKRYVVNESGVSPMSVPGQVGCSYTADGLEHEPSGKPSSLADDHLAQLDKRQNKLTQFDFGASWASIKGEGSVAVLTWGSCHEAVLEAQQRLSSQGINIKVISLRLLLPAQIEAFSKEMEGVERVLVIELSHSLQFYHYLRAYYSLPQQVETFARPGPLALSPNEIVTKVQSLMEESL